MRVWENILVAVLVLMLGIFLLPGGTSTAYAGKAEAAGTITVVENPSIVTTTIYGKTIIAYSYSSGSKIYMATIDTSTGEVSYSELTPEHMLVIPVKLGNDYVVAYTYFSTLYIGLAGSGTGYIVPLSNPRLIAVEKYDDAVYFLFNTNDGLAYVRYTSSNDIQVLIYTGLVASEAAVIDNNGFVYLRVRSGDTIYYISGDTAYKTAVGEASAYINSSGTVYAEKNAGRITVLDTRTASAYTVPEELDELRDVVVQGNHYILVGSRNNVYILITIDTDTGGYQVYNVTAHEGTSGELSYNRSYPSPSGVSLLFHTTSTSRVASVFVDINTSSLGETNLYYGVAGGYNILLMKEAGGDIGTASYTEPSTITVDVDTVNATATTISAPQVYSGSAQVYSAAIEPPTLTLVASPPATMTIETYNATGLTFVFQLDVVGAVLGGQVVKLTLYIDNEPVLEKTARTEFTTGRAEFKITSGELPITQNTTLTWRAEALGLSLNGSIFIYAPPEKPETPTTGGTTASTNQTTTNQTTGGATTTGNQTTTGGTTGGSTGGTTTAGGEETTSEETGGGFPVPLVAGIAIAIIAIIVVVFFFTRK